MNKKFTTKKIISILLSSFLLASCSAENVNTIQNSEQVNISSNLKKNKQNFSLKFVETKNVPTDILELTQKDAQKVSDKASKTRDIDYFDIHKNPVGLELSYGSEKAYILNYLGTSKNTEDLNIEFKSFYTKSQLGYSFNYSGPITLSSTKNIKNERAINSLKKNGSIRFELITGMPPEYIVNRFENYIERELKPALKMIYKADPDISDEIFPYAVYADNELKGFFFLISRSILRLGDRKYADLQLSTFIDTENEIGAKMAIVAFNPKTKIGVAPKYDIKTLDDLNIVETGDW